MCFFNDIKEEQQYIKQDKIRGVWEMQYFIYEPTMTAKKWRLLNL